MVDGAHLCVFAGGWLHVGITPFGLQPSARRRPPVWTPRFLLFLRGCGSGRGARDYLTHMTDLEPVRGGSAAVSGVMGGVRFVFQRGSAR